VEIFIYGNKRAPSRDIAHRFKFLNISDIFDIFFFRYQILVRELFQSKTIYQPGTPRKVFDIICIILYIIIIFC